MRKRVELPVRIRRLVGGRGVFRVDRTVPCPSRGSVPRAICEACDKLHPITSSERHISCYPDSSRRASRPRLSSPIAAAEQTTIDAVMTSDVVCVTADLSLEEVAAIFLGRDLSAVVVLDYEDFPIGVLSQADLLRDYYADQSVTRPIEIVELSDRGASPRPTVAQLMRPQPQLLRETDTLAHAAATMAALRARHLLVVADDGSLAGILSAFDLARWIAGAL